MTVTRVCNANDSLCAYCDADPFDCEKASHKIAGETGANVIECSEFMPRSIRHSYPIATVKREKQ